MCPYFEELKIYLGKGWGEREREGGEGGRGERDDLMAQCGWRMWYTEESRKTSRGARLGMAEYRVPGRGALCLGCPPCIILFPTASAFFLKSPALSSIKQSQGAVS